MDSACSVCLSRHSSEVDNVSWSADHRIAVSTPELVFVCTLQASTPSHKPPTHMPSVVISTAHALPLPKDVGMASPKALTEHIDPAYAPSSQSCDCFKRTDWSPTGCSKLGGCVLTALTVGGRLVVYTPPPKQWRVWKHTLTLSDSLAHSPHLHRSHFHNLSDGGKTLSTKCSAFAWRPHTLAEGGYGYVAMTTRAGRLVLVKVSIPVTECSSVRVVWADTLPCCGGGEGWGCALKWRKSGKMLAVGCTDGQMLCLSWTAMDTPPHISQLWPTDGVPVYHMTFLTRPPHIVCAKGSLLLVCPLDGGVPLTVCGQHTLPVSGVSAMDEAVLLSASLDGTVQVWEWAETQPRPLNMGLSSSGLCSIHRVGVSHNGLCSIHGLAVSHNGLLAAVTVSDRMSRDRKQGSHLHFLNLVTTEATMTTIQISTVARSLWDVYEVIRQLHLQSPPTHTYSHFEYEVQMCLQIDPGLSALMTLQDSVMRNQPPTQQHQARRCVLSAHAQKCVKLSADSATLDPVSELSRQLMLSWLSRFLGPASTSKHPAPSQLCPVCGREVWLKDELLSYGCAEGHTWDICPLTFHLVSVCSECSVCAQCGCGVNTTTSLRPLKDSWLHCLLSQQTQCLYCGGFYEAVC